MTKDKTFTTTASRGWGDIAIDGLWPGLVGGLLMISYLVVGGLISGLQPLETIAGFLPDTSLPPLAGLGSHLAVSAVYGALFSLVAYFAGRVRPRRFPVWLIGILYALLLWLVAWLVVVPSGLSGLGRIPAGHLLIAHLAYGLTTGLMLKRP